MVPLVETLQEAALSSANAAQFIGAAIGLTTLAGFAKSTFEVVHAGEMGIRMRQGNPQERAEAIITEPDLRIVEDLRELTSTSLSQYVIDGPGLYVLRPFHKFVRVNVRDRNTSLFAASSEHNTETPKGLRINSKKDGRQYEVFSTATWFVRSDGDNPYKAKFNVNNEKDNNDQKKDAELEARVSSICSTNLRKILRNLTSEESIEDLDDEKVTDSMKEHCKKRLLEYRVALKYVELNSVANTDASLVAQTIQNTFGSEFQKLANVIPLRNAAA